MKRGKRGSPKAKPAVDEKSATDSEELVDPRERAMKDLKEEIRLEEHEEKQGALLDAKDAAIREAQLERTTAVFSRHWAVHTENERLIEQQERWARYGTCDGLPDPESLPELNAFAYIWSTEEEDASMDNVEEKRRAAICLLNKLEEIVRFSMAVSKKYRAEHKEIATELRNRLQRWIDMACYRLLRNIEENMILENPKTVGYVRATEKLVCCFWAPITLPIGMKRPMLAKDLKPIQVQFKEMQLTIKLPTDVDCHRMAIRGLWLAHDHYSAETRSRLMPDLPERLLGLWGRSPDMLEFARNEYQEKVRIREEQAEDRRLRLEEKKALLELMEHPPAIAPERRTKRGKKKRPRSARRDRRAELDSALSSKAESLPYLPTPYEIIRQREDEARLEVRRLLFTRCEKTEVNLRKYRILGGVFRVDLLYQPPQPKDLGKGTYLTTLELPKEPKFVAFSRRYVTPEPVPESERTPEAIEAEMKALELAMEALVLITLRLPDTIFWFEPPLIAQWMPEKEIWSTKHIHDVKFNEEQKTIAFRSGRLGVHGLAAYKFSNLPFQSWELKPETGKSGREHGGVVLSITAATIQVEFVVREDRVCLNSLTGHSNDPLKGILGEYDDLERLIKRLKSLGCELFPDRDAISYLTGINTKHPAAENHLRRCMAMLSTAYTFAWSRWNATRDFRQIVVQLKEMHGCLAKERTNLTLLVTPSRTMRVRCTEVSPEFSELPYDEHDTEYYSDLYQLALHTAGIKSRLLMERISSKLVSTVVRLLERTNVIGMSS
ncbi:dynein axonemal intermediate chain 7 isoform X1 [Megachile rotundata]|uniref:dynein axonemal intermediate chain 7 isoform X1 n=1 Tax=Megachile rotundata TaxID=143995 RepID=UPI003FCFFB5A